LKLKEDFNEKKDEQKRIEEALERSRKEQLEL